LGKKTETIPWGEIEIRYAKLFKNDKGNVAKPLRMALGALIIQTEYQFSDEEVVLQIQEGPYLQYFCGLPGYTDEKPFDSSTMVYFRKRLTSEILGEINELIIAKAEKKPKLTDKDDVKPADDEDARNEGTLTVDASCAPQNIRYPQDTSLLNEARENLEAMIDEMHDPKECQKPRTYRKKARKDYLNIAKSKRKSLKKIRKAIGKQLRYIRRDLGIVDKFLKREKILSEKKLRKLGTIRAVYEQQLKMFENRSHRIENRIVSLSQPWIRPIVRGKAKAKCEFGSKVDISVTDGFVRLEHSSFEAYNESENLEKIIERYRDRTGHYPERVLADKIYRTRNNLKYCKEKGIRLSGKPLGRPKRDPEFDKKQERRDEIDRVEVERKFSHAKGSFGLGLIRTKLQKTSETAISLAILLLNISYIQRLFLFLFKSCIILLIPRVIFKKVAFIQ